MTLDYTLSIDTPILVAIISIAVAVIQRSIKKNRRQHELTDIKVESICHAVFVSMNGVGEGARVEYEKKKTELMKEKKFIEE